MSIIKKLYQSEGLRYLFFGGLTTLVYLGTMSLTLYLLAGNQLVAFWSETIAQAVSITFAYFTNQKWVFKSSDAHGFKAFISFSIGRVGFALFAMAVKWWFGDVHPHILMTLLHTNFKLTMLLLSLVLMVLSVTFNYFWSILLVFTKPKGRLY